MKLKIAASTLRSSPVKTGRITLQLADTAFHFVRDAVAGGIVVLGHGDASPFGHQTLATIQQPLSDPALTTRLLAAASALNYALM